MGSPSPSKTHSRASRAEKQASADAYRLRLLAGEGHYEAYTALGLTRDTARHARALLIEQGTHPTPEQIAEYRAAHPMPDIAASAPVPETPRPRSDSYDEQKGTWEGCRTTDRIPQSLDDLLALFQVDTRVWQVSTWECGGHELGSLPRPVGSTQDGWSNPSTQPQVTPLYRIKAKFARKVREIAVRAELDAMIAEAKSHAPSYAPFTRHAPAGGHYAILSVYDLHIGKLAYGQETGHGNYDSDIAEQMFNDAIDDLLLKTQVFGLERICFPVGNDLLNTEAGSLATTGLTAQNVDGRPKKTFRQTWKMLVAGIDRMRAVAPVDVVVIPGNHAEFSEFAVGEVLDAWYHNCADVSVDNSPTLRKYYPFGKCLLCFTHGDRESHARLPGIVAAEQPNLWAAATAGREINIGHFHKVALNEYPGIRLRTLPSLCAPDQWHAATGWVGSRRSAEAYVWNKETGLVGSAVYNAPV